MNNLYNIYLRKKFALLLRQLQKKWRHKASMLRFYKKIVKN